MNNQKYFVGGMIFGGFLGMILTAFLGFVLDLGPVSHRVYEATMVNYNLAHFDEKNKSFILDSLEFKKDTIIIRKKSN